MSTYTITKHAAEEMEERGITTEILDQVMLSPGQIVPERDELVAFQSIMDLPACGKMLIRAIVDPSDPKRVITVYRTSKITKYWRPS